MKILVYPHTMEIGGSQLNAVQLAIAVRDRGHEVIVASEPGPLVQRVREAGLEHIEFLPHWGTPSPYVVRTLVEIARARNLDVVHGYEWPPIVEAFFGAGLMNRTPVVGTIMTMSVAPFVPRSVPLMVGTERIRQSAIAAGHRRVTLLEPPVDTHTDAPTIDGSPFRSQHGIAPGDLLVVVICRLVPELKLEGLLAACDAFGELARRGRAANLIIVGDGRARAQVEERAAAANAAAGRQAVQLAGEMADPRAAYAAADVVIGQGGSALRGMSFGKPLIVIGEDGFSEILTAASAPLFLQQGWYGLGPGSLGKGVPALVAALEQLLASKPLRDELGAFARQLAVDRFSLERAAKIQEEEYARAAENRIGRPAQTGDAIRTLVGLSTHKLRRKYEMWRGTIAIDDFNSRAKLAKVLRGE